ncbi:conserved hypothetical protein [Streptomyces sp. Mg1]|nr:conserved hypothetical protein [Streptomyces sp. Mg1]
MWPPGAWFLQEGSGTRPVPPVAAGRHLAEGPHPALSRMITDWDARAAGSPPN